MEMAMSEHECGGSQTYGAYKRQRREFGRHDGQCVKREPCIE